MKQQYQTRYELLHENYQKWLTGFTRHAVSWGVCHPNIYYFHNLTPGWVSFNGEKPEIAIVPQSLHRLLRLKLVWLCWLDLMTGNSLDDWTKNLKHKSEKDLEQWIIARQGQSEPLTNLMDQYVLMAYRTSVDAAHS